MGCLNTWLVIGKNWLTAKSPHNPHKTVRCRTKKRQSNNVRKTPYAVAQRSRHIPDDDPKCKVNVDYKSPPREFR